MDGEVDGAVITALCEALGDEGAIEVVQLYLDALEPESVRLADAVAAGDTSAIRRSAHDLKSTSGTVGAVRVAHAMAEVERLAASGDVSAIDPIVKSTLGRLRSVRTGLEMWLAAVRGA